MKPIALALAVLVSAACAAEGTGSGPAIGSAEAAETNAAAGSQTPATAPAVRTGAAGGRWAEVEAIDDPGANELVTGALEEHLASDGRYRDDPLAYVLVCVYDYEQQQVDEVVLAILGEGGPSGLRGVYQQGWIGSDLGPRQPIGASSLEEAQTWLTTRVDMGFGPSTHRCSYIDHR